MEANERVRNSSVPVFATGSLMPVLRSGLVNDGEQNSHHMRRQRPEKVWRRLPALLPVLMALGVLIVGLWWAFGLRVSGTYDEWDFAQRADSGGPFITQSTRPLLALPYFFAHMLTPDSFIGLNLVQAAILLAKGVIAYLVLCRLLTGQRALAFVASILFVVYPSDAGVVQLRSTSVHASVLFYLLAVYLLLLAWERPNGWTIAGMVGAQAVGLAMYDSGVVLMLFSLLLVYGMRGRGRHLMKVAVAWCVVPLCALVGLALAVRIPGDYHAKILSLGHPRFLALESLRQTRRVYAQHFWRGWVHGAGDLASMRYVLTAVVVTVLIVALLVFHRTWTQSPDRFAHLGDRFERRRLLIMAAWAFVAVLMGYVLYIPTAVRNDTFRVFLYSSWGAAIVVAIALLVASSLFGRWSKLVFVVATGLLIALSTVRAMNNLRAFVDEGLRQQHVKARIVDQAPRLTEGTSIMIIDREPHLTLRAFSACERASRCIETHLRYVYGAPDLDVHLCWPDSRGSGVFGEVCHFGAGEIETVYTDAIRGTGARYSSPYESTVVFEESENGPVLLQDLRGYVVGGAGATYRPFRLVDRGGSPPKRVWTLFARWPFPKQPPRPETVRSVAIEFESVLAFVGYGWSTPEGSRTWTNSQRSVLDLPLKRGEDYLLEFRIIRGIAPDVLRSLRVIVNGEPVEVSARKDQERATVYRGRIKGRTLALDATKTRVSFSVSRVASPASLGLNLDDRRTLGLYFDWLRIRPWTS